MENKGTNPKGADRGAWRYEQTGLALSQLCQAWLRAGGNFAVSTTRAVADALEDLTDAYCDTTGKSSKSE